MSEPAYRRILATVEPGAHITIDDLRPVVEASQLTTFERGELFRWGVRNGYLTTRHVTKASTCPSRKNGRVQVYRRTRKAVGVAV
jgi:hypothetical protein